MVAFLLESPETSQSITRLETRSVCTCPGCFITMGSNLRTLPNPNHFPVALTTAWSPHPLNTSQWLGAVVRTPMNPALRRLKQSEGLRQVGQLGVWGQPEPQGAWGLPGYATGPPSSRRERESRNGDSTWVWGPNSYRSRANYAFLCIC